MNVPYYLHRKTGGVYALLYSEYVRQSYAVGEVVSPVYQWGHRFPERFTVTDPIPADARVAFYINAMTGQRWARPSEMFHDGRFTLFESVPDLPGLIPLP